jgi:hypothetical protein
MLTVVVNRVDAVIAGHATGEQSIEFLEGDRDAMERFTRPSLGKKLLDRIGDCGGGTHLNRIRNVIVVTAKVLHTAV